MRIYDLHNIQQQAPQITELYLNAKGLKELPIEIRNCKQLKKLSLASNQLTRLPDWIGELSSLEKLDLERNQLKKLPSTFTHLRQLSQLNLAKNKCTSSSLKYLPLDLKELDLSNNQLKAFLPEKTWSLLERLNLDFNKIQELSLEKLPALKYLQLSKNKISEWPGSLKKLSQLEQLSLTHNPLEKAKPNLKGLIQLRKLDLSATGLKKIPSSINTCLHLRILYIAENKLSELPASLSQLQWLVELNLGKNLFQHIPRVLFALARLDSLDMSYNQLSELVDLSNLSRLRILNLTHNQLEVIQSFPPNIQKIHLNTNPIKALHGLEKANKLESIELRKHHLSQIPDGLFQLSKLKQIKGLLAYQKAQQCLAFIKALHTHQYPIPWRAALYQFWQDEKNANYLSQEAILQALSLPFPSLQKRIINHLLSQNPNKQFPTELKSLKVIGTIKNKTLKTQLAKAEISLSPTAENLLLADPPYSSHLHLPSKASFFSLSQLQNFLRNKGIVQKSYNLNAEQIIALQRLLLHPHPTQVQIALLSISQLSLPETLDATLILAWKLQAPGKIKERLRTYIQAKHYSLIRKALQLNRKESKEAQKLALQKWFGKAKITDLKQEDFISLLKYI